MLYQLSYLALLVRSSIMAEDAEEAKDAEAQRRRGAEAQTQRRRGAEAQIQQR